MLGKKLPWLMKKRYRIAKKHLPFGRFVSSSANMGHQNVAGPNLSAVAQQFKNLPKFAWQLFTERNRWGSSAATQATESPPRSDCKLLRINQRRIRPAHAAGSVICTGHRMCVLSVREVCVWGCECAWLWVSLRVCGLLVRNNCSAIGSATGSHTHTPNRQTHSHTPTPGGDSSC